MLPRNRCQPEAVETEVCNTGVDDLQDSDCLENEQQEPKSHQQDSDNNNKEKHRHQKRSHDSMTKSVSMSRKPKYQRCLAQSFHSQDSSLRTLTWDPNIMEDSCDCESLQPLPSSQPEKAVDSEDDSADDSEDELPDVLSSALKDPIVKGTLLWVKYYKYPYWPAIVRNCYYRKKVLQKVTFIFIGDVDQFLGGRGRPFTLKYTKEKMVKFAADTDKHARFKEEGLKSKYAARFRDAIAKVEDFMVKRCLQVTDDPFAFFAEDLDLDKWNTQEVPSEEDDERTSVSSSQSEAGEEPMKDENEHTENVSQDTSIEEDTESSDKNEEMSEKMINMKIRRKERGERLLGLIKSDKRIKNMLMDIYNGKRKCERHDRFLSAPRSQMYQRDSGFGPIDDEDQQLELVRVLGEYLKAASGKDMPDIAYIFQVWLPEALIEATNRILKKKRSVAEQYYHQGPHLLKEEKKLQHVQMIEGGKTIHPEDAQRYEAARESLKREIFATPYSNE